MRRDRPLHVTLRLLDGLPRLRRKAEFDRVKSAIQAGHKPDFRVVHFSVLSNHDEEITTPKQARNVLLYVVGNYRKHCAQRGVRLRPRWVDPFSSARQLDGWNQPVRLEPGVVEPPRTWILRTGWRKHGLLDAHSIPASAAR